jgi:hypothetical protein
MMSIEDVAAMALLMVTVPPHVNMLEVTAFPSQQPYVGRG